MVCYQSQSNTKNLALGKTIESRHLLWQERRLNCQANKSIGLQTVSFRLQTYKLSASKIKETFLATKYNKSNSKIINNNNNLTRITTRYSLLVLFAVRCFMRERKKKVSSSLEWQSSSRAKLSRRKKIVEWYCGRQVNAGKYKDRNDKDKKRNANSHLLLLWFSCFCLEFLAFGYRFCCCKFSLFFWMNRKEESWVSLSH